MYTIYLNILERNLIVRCYSKDVYVSLTAMPKHVAQSYVERYI